MSKKRKAKKRQKTEKITNPRAAGNTKSFGKDQRLTKMKAIQKIKIQYYVHTVEKIIHTGIMDIKQSGLNTSLFVKKLPKAPLIL
jgi:hypothetical protein